MRQSGLPFFVSLCFKDDVLLASDFFPFPGWDLLELLHFVIHYCFCIWTFIACGIGSELEPFCNDSSMSAKKSSWQLGLRQFRSCSCGFMRFHKKTYFVFGTFWDASDSRSRFRELSLSKCIFVSQGTAGFAGLNLVWARSTHMLAILELNWCLGPRTSAERNVTSRRSSATPKRSKKLNGMQNAHNRRSAMKPLSLFSGTRQLEQTKNLLAIHVSNHLAMLHGTRTCFSVHSVVPSTLVELWGFWSLSATDLANPVRKWDASLSVV